MINSDILTTKQLVLYCHCKEKIDVDKLAGSERVKAGNLGVVRIYSEMFKNFQD